MSLVTTCSPVITEGESHHGSVTRHGTRCHRHGGYFLGLESLTVGLVPDVVLTISTHSHEGVKLEVEGSLMHGEHSVVWLSVSSEVEVVLVLVLKVVEIDVLDPASALDGGDCVSIAVWERLHMPRLVLQWRGDRHHRVDLTRVESLLKITYHDLVIGCSAH